MRRVVFRHADLEDGDHRIALHARRRAESGRCAARGEQRDLIADPHIELVGEAAAERDAGLLVETVERAEADILGDGLELFEVRFAQAPHQRAARGGRRRDHHLPFDQRQRVFDAVHLADARRHVVIVGEVGQAMHHDMAVKPEHLVEQLLAEAVHHRHDDDQRRDAERDADEGEAGDDRDEALLAARPQIAKRHHPFEGRECPRALLCAHAASLFASACDVMSRFKADSKVRLWRAPVARSFSSISPEASPLGPTTS